MAELVAAAVDSSGELSVFEVDTGTRLHRTRAFRGYVYDWNSIRTGAR